MPIPDSEIQQAYRVRISIFVVCSILTVAVLETLYRGIQTLNRLEVVEQERDQWQRPSDIMQALGLKEGSVAADIGSGAGYFALKLSSPVGKSGEVLAVDIQRLPLIFLRIRALLRRESNIQTILANRDDPDLPRQAVDAVLIVNAYHEFEHPRRTLDCIMRSLRSKGRLVVADRGPRSGDEAGRALERNRHELSPKLVESELLRSGFELVVREDRFIDRPSDEQRWWLIVGRKP